jgi:hypothetical protein
MALQSRSVRQAPLSGELLHRGGCAAAGIGGTATRVAHVEVLYMMEFLGLILIWIGYRCNVRPGVRGAPDSEVDAAVHIEAPVEAEPAAV